jgi:hypothetical protein
MPENAQLETSRERARPDASVDLSVPIEMATRNFTTAFSSSENVWYTNTSSVKPRAEATSHDRSVLFGNLMAVSTHPDNQHSQLLESTMVE